MLCWLSLTFFLAESPYLSDTKLTSVLWYKWHYLALHFYDIVPKSLCTAQSVSESLGIPTLIVILNFIFSLLYTLFIPTHSVFRQKICLPEHVRLDLFHCTKWVLEYYWVLPINLNSYVLEKETPIFGDLILISTSLSQLPYLDSFILTTVLLSHLYLRDHVLTYLVRSPKVSDLEFTIISLRHPISVVPCLSLSHQILLAL